MLFSINAGTTLVVRLQSGRLVSGVTKTDLGPIGARYFLQELRTGETLELNSNFDVPLDWKEVDALLNFDAPEAVTGNTHCAVISTSVPPGMEIVSRGPERFCRESLAVWIENHPLGEFETGEVLQVVHRTPNASDELTDLLGITPANVVEAALLAALRRAVGVEP